MHGVWCLTLPCLCLQRLLKPIEVIHAIVEDTLAWKRPAVTIGSAIALLYIVNGYRICAYPFKVIFHCDFETGASLP